jgi:hypothetical protein
VLDGASLVGSVEGADSVISCIGPTKNFLASDSGVARNGEYPVCMSTCRRTPFRHAKRTLSDGEELSVGNRLDVPVKGKTQRQIPEGTAILRAIGTSDFAK